MAFPNPHTRLFLFAKENGERRKWHSEKIERIQEWECRLPISALSRSEMDHVFKARLDLHGQTSFYSTEKVGRVGRRWDSVSWLRKLINIGKHVKHLWIGQHIHGCQSSWKQLRQQCVPYIHSSSCWKLHMCGSLCIIVLSCLPVLLTAKSVAERCIKFAFYIMTSFGLQGEWLSVISGKGEQLCRSHGEVSVVLSLIHCQQNLAIKEGGSWF